MFLTDFISKEKAIQMRDCIVEKIKGMHFQHIYNSDGDVFKISDTYCGVWLEHTHDPVVWGMLTGDYSIAKNQIRLFFKNQLANGRLPFCVVSDGPRYNQIQECVSVGSLVLAVYEATGDRKFLEESYNALSGWDSWLVNNRMTMGKGLIEMWCGFDTGHDNSSRLDGMKYKAKLCPDGDGYPGDCRVLPVLAPDMNAVFYGNRVALSKMADIMKNGMESFWKEKAEQVRKKMFELLFDENHKFFYDVDKNGNMLRHRNISVTNVLCEGVCDGDLANEIMDRYLFNEKEFYTPFPFPAVSVAMPEYKKNLAGNSWGYYTQGNTVLRTVFWLSRYGRQKEYEEILTKWLVCWAKSDLPYGQELDPFTGEPSECSPYYSAGMLACLLALKLYGI